MRVKICYGGETVNIISAYAPQVGCTEEEKSSFWNSMNEVTQELEEQKKIVVGADFNGHVGNVNDEKIPEDWRESILIPIFKGKGVVQEYSNYRGIKLMSHTLKILERVIDGRLREEVRIEKEQLGFMKGSGTTDGIFCIRQLMKKFREKQRDLHLVFTDLEKAHDSATARIMKMFEGEDCAEKFVRIIRW
ncbi:uncharacterized protein LOC135205252 [Macrobrachium nipponense]|uniref:uncharacterized protein LOC135205252 n=1 Tax=Macrobrachium nipponense TaxID=159736 RepID=UPI0030C7B313